MHELADRLRPYRLPVLAGFDVACWVLSYLGLALLVSFAGLRLRGPLTHALAVALICATAYLLIGAVVKLHQGRAALGSFEDAVLLGSVAAPIAGLAIVAEVAFDFFRLFVGLAAPLLAILLMLWGRALYRLLREQAENQRLGGPRRPVVVIGAGEGGRQLITSMMRDPGSRWRPVAVVDDDPLKRHRRLRGVPVLGRSDQFPGIARRLGADTAILAVPSVSAERVRELTQLATDSGLRLKVLPGPGELINPREVRISDVKDIDVNELLGRQQVDTDVPAIAGYLAGRRVLVTGAGGSIGSELSRQIAKFGPSELIMLDRDESALHSVELSIHGKAMLDTDETVLGDIRDGAFVKRLFETRKPQVVFHAAALKHLPLLEKAPDEAVKTNVWGTLKVLEAAAANGVDTFVNVSTDKAANPCSVLGYSKRLAEGLTAAIAKEATGSFLSVRFGNVLGSRGSVLTAFARQIAEGGPVTVTDPRVTRYFMTTREAVQLVIQAGAIGRNGEVLILDMGEPVSIDAVARQLIDLSGRPIEVVYTGLRHGEKMHEELFGDGESQAKAAHALISHTPAPAFEPVRARLLDVQAARKTLINELSICCHDLTARLGSEASHR